LFGARLWLASDGIAIEARGMSEALGKEAAKQEVRLPLAVIYMRVAAMLLLAAGLARACQVLGILAPVGLSFDDLTPAMRGGAIALLIVDLLASVGLWIGAAWGPVMWGVALTVEVSMYTLFSDTFGSYPLRVVVHGGIFLGFLAVSFVEWRRTLD
jgi:hypothetical protein